MDSSMHHILRLSLLELLRLTGFTSTSPSALNTLVDVLERYLAHLALSSRATAELSCRTIVNVDDVALALKKDDVTVEELARQLDLVDEVELSFMPPPTFPLAKSSPPPSSSLSDPLSSTSSAPSSAAPPGPLPVRLEGLKLRIGREAGAPLAKASSFPLQFISQQNKQESEEKRDGSEGNQTNGTITQGGEQPTTSSKDPSPQADHMDVDPSPQAQQAPVATATTATPAAPLMQPQILLSPSKKSTTTTTQGAQHSNKNPFLRLSTSGTTRPPRERENGIHKRHSVTTVTLRALAPNSPQRFTSAVAIKPPPFVSTTVNPYQLALEAAPKVRPIVNMRQIEKKSGPQPVEVLNFSMLGNVGDLSSDRGVEWNEFVTKKRKGGRPPKRRDLPTAVGSESTLSLAETSRSSKMELPAAADEEAGGESQRDGDRKLSNWFEELDNDNWSSEGSEEDDSNNFNGTIDQF